MLTAATVFQIINSIALLSWLFLIFFPNLTVTKKLIRSYVAPAFFSLVYAVLIIFKFGTAEGGFDSLAAVMQLFNSPWAVTAGWAHYLAFDLFIGIWIVQDSEQKHISRLIRAPILFFTFMLGPIGLISHLSLRYIVQDSTPIMPFLRKKLAKFTARNNLMSNSAIIFLGLSIISAIGIGLDARVVDGSPVWLKPTKFFASLGIYYFTIAWLIGDLKDHQKQSYGHKFAIWSLVVGIVEMLIICLQAARGVRSHYNIESTLDAALYYAMGLMIVSNLFAVIHFWSRWQRSVSTSLYKLGASYGFLSFVASGFLACYMSSLPSSRVGVVDHATSSLIFGWNQAGGDLRISHFLGLHGLQIFTILGNLAKPLYIKEWLIHTFGIIYLLVIFALFLLAALGIPVLAQ